jgi:acetolactate synthase-1/2/3 large subunit
MRAGRPGPAHVPTREAALYRRKEGSRAHDFLEADCGGAIGGGLPLGLGAAVACSNRKTVVFQGDGSCMYTAQALWTIAREKVDVTVVLLKNDDYAILEIELARVRDGAPDDWRQTR